MLEPAPFAQSREGLINARSNCLRRVARVHHRVRRCADPHRTDGVGDRVRRPRSASRQKNTGDILPRTIGGASVEYISLEDGGDTTRAVQNVKKLVQENNVDALIGPSTTPNAFAILDVIAEAKVPMMATVGTSAVVEPLDAKKRWVFKTTQNDDLIAAALLSHMTQPRREVHRVHRFQRSLRRKLAQGFQRARREGRRESGRD